MDSGRAQLPTPFESVVTSVSELPLADKRRLWQLLEQEIARAEEEAWERDPEVRAEIREARSAYAVGDYVTIDEYMARRS